MIRDWKTTKPQLEDVITDKNMLDFATWLKANNMPPTWLDIHEQHAIAWTVNHDGKNMFVVLDDKDALSFMVQGLLTSEYQSYIIDNNLQDIVTENLQHCSRKDGEHCGNCDLPSHVAGVDLTIFGKEAKNICCGHMITFKNPDEKSVATLKMLLGICV